MDVIVCGFMYLTLPLLMLVIFPLMLQLVS